ncbi:hypothetical protein CVS40_11482 [Lucilia cuprina]|nr:hypothetical protein CVS40_11482 [Lucilia cuprina]
MSQRNLRSGRNRNRNINIWETATPTTSHSTQNTIPAQVSTNSITPLLGFSQGTGPLTHSSPESESNITTPTYSSSTAREITGQGNNTVRLNEETNPNAAVNEDVRKYVSASIESVQESIRREMQNMQLMIPRLIMESLRSERGNSLDNGQNRSYVPNNSQQTPFNVNNRVQQQNPQISQQQQHFLPQQLFNNDSQNLSNPEYDHRQYHFKPITPNQLEKWGIKFDGTSKSLTVEDFVFRIETLRSDYNCTWDILMKGFHHLMTGTASTWFWSFRMKHPSCDWHTFKYHFIKKFRNFESRQAPNESADSFISEIVRLKNQMRFHIDESELVKIIKDNLKEGLSQLLFPIRIENLENLEECKRAERNIAKWSSHRMSMGNPRKLYEVDFYESIEEDEQVRQVEALQKEKLPSKQLTCWNCKTPGHSFIECLVVQRSVFCYRCGFADVTSPTCPRCVGNTKTNTRKTGPSCSNQTTSQ